MSARSTARAASRRAKPQRRSTVRRGMDVLATQAAALETIHPRPQLRRDQWIDLCGAWGFAFDDSDQGLTERWFERAEPFGREIIVPFAPESRMSGVHE